MHNEEAFVVYLSESIISLTKEVHDDRILDKRTVHVHVGMSKTWRILCFLSRQCVAIKGGEKGKQRWSEVIVGVEVENDKNRSTVADRREI